MAQHKFKENRRLRRIIIQIQVLDVESKSFFAYTENLHTEGMVLTSNEEIPVDKEFHLELVHILENDERITIPLRVLSVWNMPGDDLNLHSAGFKFIDLSPQQTQDIEKIIEELVVD